MTDEDPPADADEQALIVWFTHHAGRAHETLGHRLVVLADFVGAFGFEASRPAREELQRLDRITGELSRLAFADLTEGDPMNTNDKPAVVARDAAQAAEIAKEAAAAVSAIPGLPNKAVILHVLGGVAVIGTAVGAALTAGTVPAIIAGCVGVATYIIGWLNPTPAAVANFGTSAK
jgi:preprotein translocase subunit SecF